MPELIWADLMESIRGRPGDRYVALSPEVHSAPLAPAFMFGDIPAALNRFYHSEHVVYPTGCVFLQGAGVTGDGFPVRDGAFLTAAAYGFSPSYIQTRIDPAAPMTIRREPGRAVCLSAPGYLIYGHWLVDILPKLHILDLLGIDLANETIVVPADTPAFGHDWAKALGVVPKRIVTYNPAIETVVFDELVLPLQLRANSRASPLFVPAARSLMDRLGGAVALDGEAGPDRIYLSRQRSGRLGRKLGNAEAIEDMARARGYAIVHPEEMPIAAQVRMFRRSRLLIGEYGSALHGSMFADPSCTVCAIRGTGTDPGFLQSGLCQVFGQRLGYVFGATESLPDGTNVTMVDVNDFAAALHMMNLLASG